ncbi:hypothetical protein B0T14DRAFT_273593 [Immersiella caudata]|uniref:Uncharacterized protein n=1 Tax=Immersiella caudata TaxID=314043 RepID=A0AA39WLI3_9PEZI|nr:hypothetical protein B0T14DRAFT_273593 [Immersiella caudata]
MTSSVYLGTWVNWSHGRFRGLTLTVGQPWSDVLVASIALLVAFTGTQIWAIVCFALFRIRQSAAGNFIYHHVQAALRHSCNSPPLFAARLVEILWSSFRSRPASHGPGVRLMRETELDDLQMTGQGKQAARHPYYGGQPKSKFGQLFFLLALTVAFAVSLTAMSLLSAQVFKASDTTALIVSPYCGWPAETNVSTLFTTEDNEIQTMLLVPARAQYQTARAYVRSCYAEAGDGKIPGTEKQCNTLVVPKIGSTLTMQSQCPFPGDKVCKADSAVVESQVVDSRDTLGINTPDPDRISARKILTCVPIDADQWASDWLDAEPLGGVAGDKLKGYAVGKMPGRQGILAEYPVGVSNYSSIMASQPYTLFWAGSMPENQTQSEFIPRDELKVPNADLLLIALSSRAYFGEPVSDPWFDISTSQTDQASGDKIYVGPPGWRFLACLEQYQLCTASHCSNTSAMYQLQSVPNYGLGDLPPSQKAVADLVWKSLWAGQTRYALEMMAPQVLVANEKVMGSWFMRSAKIPSDQWITEVWNLANISLAALQRRPSDYASPAPLLQEHPERIARPDSEESRDLCGRIRIHTAEYTSFRILGLVFLILGAAFAALVNQVLPSIFKGRVGGAAIPDWLKYDFYHLAMAVCEAREIQPWRRRDEKVPVMVDGELRFAI